MDNIEESVIKAFIETFQFIHERFYGQKMDEKLLRNAINDFRREHERSSKG